MAPETESSSEWLSHCSGVDKLAKPCGFPSVCMSEQRMNLVDSGASTA